jgi:regulator of protease activity HflC (stomatin/prohibitin superfamily)
MTTPRIEGPRYQRAGVGPVVTLVSFGLLILVGLTVVFGSWYTVDQTQRAVLLRNGALVSIEPPGLHFKLPWFESVSKIDMQTRNETYTKVNSYSADQQPADLKVSVTFHVAPDRVADMYSRFGGDIEAAVSRLIAPHMNQEIKVVFGQYTAQRAISARGQLNADAAKALIDAIAYDPVLVIEGVQIEDIAWSPQYIQSVEARMRAEVAVQQQQQLLAQEKIKADIAVTQATGRASSIRAEAQAQADATVLKGNAEATAIAARSKALSDNPAIISLTQAEKWNGVLPTTMVPGSAVPFLDVSAKPK